MTSGRPGRKTADEERKLMELLKKAYDYLNNNFLTFKEETRVHIALELIKKRVPMEMRHEGTITFSVGEVLNAAKRIDADARTTRSLAAQSHN